MAWGAYSGNIKAIDWLYKHGCPTSEWTCAWAAKHNKLEVLKWLRKNGHPWDVNTLMEASFEGHVKVIKWAIENGCSTDLISEVPSFHCSIYDMYNYNTIDKLTGYIKQYKSVV